MPSASTMYQSWWISVGVEEKVFICGIIDFEMRQPFKLGTPGDLVNPGMSALDGPGAAGIMDAVKRTSRLPSMHGYR
jgi:hypothetical protein